MENYFIIIHMNDECVDVQTEYCSCDDLLKTLKKMMDNNRDIVAVHQIL